MRLFIISLLEAPHDIILSGLVLDQLPDQAATVFVDRVQFRIRLLMSPLLSS